MSITSMALTAMLKRGMALALTAAVAVAAADAAQAATKKSKHGKPVPAAHTYRAPSTGQPAQPGPPDPGVYK